MNVEIIKASSSEEKKKFADIALKSKLYVSGWHLSYRLREIRENDKDKEICLAKLDNKFVGVSIIVDKNIQCFVRKKFRRNKIGKKLIEANSAGNKETFAYLGVSGSHDFWTACSVEVKYEI